MSRSTITLSPVQVATAYAELSPKIKQHGKEWRGPCPIHNGEDDNFAVNSETGLWHCHSKCGRGGNTLQLVVEIGKAADLKAARSYLADLLGHRSNGSARPEIVATYDYTDIHGELLYQVLRYKPKNFRIRTPDATAADGWTWKRKVNPVLYRLPELKAAETVFIAEGEKDVDAMHKLGLAATCNPGGAGKWRSEFNEHLRGRQVFVIPDNDQPGKTHAEQIEASLRGVAASVRIVKLPDLPEKGDVSDWISRGGTREQLLALAEQSAVPSDRASSPVSATPVKPALYDGHEYSVHNGGIIGWRPSKEAGHVSFRVTNFDARITQEHIRDDGIEQTRYCCIQATLNGVSTEVEVPAKDFRTMNWIPEKLGSMAIVWPGQSEHAKTAIQFLSGHIPTTRAYSHTGWTTIDGEPYYLHGGGAIGRNGARSDVTVNLKQLPNYILPVPPDDPPALKAAIRWSLAVLDIAPDSLTVPVLAAVYRAILGQTNFSLHIVGQSEQGKSQLAALAQQHFGPGMDAKHLPASWQSTGNATATRAFFAKDAIMAVDDFVYSGGSAEQQKLNAEADRVLRAQGNASARDRISIDGATINSGKPPRGLILSTGEHVPKGKSLNARMVILPFPKGAMNWNKLTQCQEAAERGQLAAAAAAFIRWVASRKADIDQLLSIRRYQRQSLDSTGGHMRTGENLDSLRLGFSLFLEFAKATGTIDASEAAKLDRRAEAAFSEVVQRDEGKYAENDPARIFLRLIATALQTGKAHCASPGGDQEPNHAIRWGWQLGPNHRLISQGAKIGWVDGTDLYLDPDGVFQIVNKLASERGESIGTLDTVRRDLKEQGFLAQTDENRRTVTVRRRIEELQRSVLYLKQSVFWEASIGYADSADSHTISTSSEVEKERVV